METAAWLTVGLLFGLLVAAAAFLVITGAYIGSDMDAFRKWVDSL